MGLHERCHGPCRAVLPEGWCGLISTGRWCKGLKFGVLFLICIYSTQKSLYLGIVMLPSQAVERMEGFHVCKIPLFPFLCCPLLLCLPG